MHWQWLMPFCGLAVLPKLSESPEVEFEATQTEKGKQAPMSIINDHAQVNRAMQALHLPKAPKDILGRYQCRNCYDYLGQLSAGTILDCPSCGAINRVVEE
jgi:rubrerythrin